MHVCIDDATRLAYVEVLSDETAITAIGFLRRAIAFYRRHGIRIQRLMTDGRKSSALDWEVSSWEPVDGCG